MVSPSEVVLIRHATSIRNEAYDEYTAGNLQPWGFVNGLPDSKTILSPNGVRQAWETGYKLRELYGGEKFDAVIHSPLTRAKLTANFISAAMWPGKFIRLKSDARLSEVNFGYFKPFHWDFIAEHFPGEYKRRMEETQFYYKPPLGESIEHKTNHELKPFLRELNAKYAKKRVLIVAHSLVIRSLKMLLMEKSPLKFCEVKRSPNCGVTVFKEGKLVSENEIYYPNQFLREKDRLCLTQEGLNIQVD